MVCAIKKRKLTIISQTGTDCNIDLCKVHMMARDRLNMAFSAMAPINPATMINEPISVCGIFGVNLMIHAIRKQRLRINTTFDKIRTM